MQARLSFASILLLTASSAWLALAQQSSQTGAFMSDRDKAGLRGPVKTVLEEQTFSGADGQQSFTTTTTQYAPDGRILEDRTGNADGSGWVKSYAYYSDGRLLKTAFGKANSAPSSETTYLYDDAQRLAGVKSGDKVQVRYQYDDKGHKSVIESYDSQPLAPNTAYAPYWEGTDLGFATHLGGTVTTLYNEQGVAKGFTMPPHKRVLSASPLISLIGTSTRCSNIRNTLPPRRDGIHIWMITSAATSIFATMPGSRLLDTLASSSFPYIPAAWG